MKAKLVIASLLLVLFSSKIILPCLTSSRFMQEEKIENEAKQSSEKEGKYKDEVSIITAWAAPVAAPVYHHGLSSASQCGLLPVRYFSIPTPPPWSKA